MAILAFAASNSKNSINHRLLEQAVAGRDDIELIRLTDYAPPIYSIDIETESGIPDSIKALYAKIREADALIISLAEHNGSPTAFFQNQIEWLSRVERSFLEGKKIVLLSTAPSRMGGENALKVVERMLPFFKGEVVATYSLPHFSSQFTSDKLNHEVHEAINQKLDKLTPL